MKKCPTTLELLAQNCLFCDPTVHGQADQVLLRSDSFYLFAGLGAIVDGYIIIAPYRCDDPELNTRSLSELPTTMIDELMFLRGLVAEFYVKQFKTQGMSFEHGRAGTCLAADNDTRHCYHAHLCCYPVEEPIWEDIRDFPLIDVNGPPEIGPKASSHPYLYIELLTPSDQLPLDRQARVVLLPQENRLKSQYLRRLLAHRVGQEHLWHWHDNPKVEEAEELAAQFRSWLRVSPKYQIDWNAKPPTIDFLASVRTTNAVGNDFVAEDYFNRYRQRFIYGGLGKFLAHLPDNSKTPPSILDVGCGPGTYTNIFQSLGLDTTAIDLSDEMLKIASVHARGDGGNPTKFRKMDALDLKFDDQSFDAIWCSAFMVHVPREQAPAQLSSLRRVLKDDGVLYLSAQIGQGCRVQSEGRTFFYYTPDELQALYREAGFEVVDTWGGASDVNTQGGKRLKSWRQFLLKKCERRVEQDSQLAGKEKTLVGLGERELLNRIQELLPQRVDQRIVFGIGDDCAAVKVPPGKLVTATIDPCPTPVISILGDSDLWYRGWFSMIINLSDLGAMGAEPLGILLSVEAPEQMQVHDFDRFFAGVREAVDAYDCPVLGGNLKDAADFNCVGTALGIIAPDRMLRRGAAQPRERLVVLGDMGRFWAGVIHRLKRIGLPPAESEKLMQSIRRPVPRLREGQCLASAQLSRCAMDSSDGLIACFYEIAQAGNEVDVHVDLDDVQPDLGVVHIANEFGMDVRKLMLAWGGWELVCTVLDEELDRLREEMARLKCTVNVVGWIEEGDGNVWLHAADQATGQLTYLASERFARQSYFTHGLNSYLEQLRNVPIVSEPSRPV